MSDETHNLDIGLDADISKVNRKLNKLADNVQTFSAKLDKIGNKANDIRKTTNAIDEQNEEIEKVNKEIKQLNEQYDKLQKESRQNARAIERTNDKLEENARNSRRADKETQNFMSSFSSSLGVATKSVAIWGAATSAIYGTMEAIRQTTDAIKKVNSEMVDLQKVMGDNIEDVDAIRSAASNLGQDYARSIDKVVSQMVEWGRQGKSQAEVIELVETTLASANATNIESADSVRYLVAALSQFDIKAQNSMSVIDKWNAVSNNFANTTAQDLGEAIKEVGSSASALGVSLDNVIGMVTAMAEATAKSGNRLGRSLRTVFANVAEVTRSGSGAINEFEEKLNELGISLRKDKETYRSVFNIFNDLSKQWDDLSQKDQTAIANMVGNKRRYTDFIALMDNFDQAVNATQTSLNSFGSAMEENERYMTSLEAQFQQAKTSAQETAVTLGEAGMKGILKDLTNVVENFFQMLTDIIKGFQEWDNATKDVLRATVTITAAITSLTVAFKGMKAVMNAISFTSLISNPLGQAALVIGSATAAISYFSHKIGENKRKTEELENAREDLNEVIRQGTDISYNQALQIEGQIKPLENLIGKYEEIQKLEKEINMGLLGEIDLTKTNFVKQLDTYSMTSALNDLRNKQDEIIKEMIKNAKLMPDTFKEINESFKNMTDQEIYEAFVNGIDKINGVTKEAIKNLTEMSAISMMGDGQYEEFATNVANAFDSTLKSINKFKEKFKDISETVKISLDQIQQKTELGLFDTKLEKEKAELQAYQSQINSLFSLQENIRLFETDLTESDTQKRVKQVKKTIDAKIKELEAEKELSEAEEERLKKYRRMKYQIQNSKNPIKTIKDLSTDINKLIKQAVKDYSDQEEVVQRIKEDNKEIKKYQDLVAKAIADTTSEREKLNQKLSKYKDALDKAVSKGAKDDAEVLREKIQQIRLEIIDLYNTSEKSTKSNPLASLMNSVKSITEEFDINDIFSIEKLNFGAVNDKISDVKNNISEIDSILKAYNQGALSKMFGINLSDEQIQKLKDAKINLQDILDTLKNKPKQKLIDAVDKIVNPKTQIDKWKELSAALRSLESEKAQQLADALDDMVMNKQFDPIVKGLKRIDSVLANITNRKSWNAPILNGDNIDQTSALSTAISSSIGNLSNLGDMGLSGLQSYKQKLINLPKQLAYEIKKSQANKNKEDDLTWSMLGYESQEDFKQKINNVLGRVNEEISNIQLESAKQKTHEQYLETLSANKQQLKDYNKELSNAKEQLGEYEKGTTAFKEQKKIIEDLTNKIKKLKKEMSFKNLNINIKDFGDLQKQFGLTDDMGINKSINNLKELESILKAVTKRRKELIVAARASKSDKFIDKLKGLDLTEKQIKEIIKQLKKNIKGTKIAWANAVTNGIAEGIDAYNEFDSFAKGLATAIKSTLKGVFNDPSLVSDLKALLKGDLGADKNGKGGIGLGFSDSTATGITSGLKTYSQGGSLGSSLASGIGAMFGPIGGAIGSAVGKIGESLWGGNQGEDPALVNSLKKQVSSAKKYLREFNLEDMVSNVRSRDDASGWESFWGGTDIKILNKEQIKKQLEKVKNIIKGAINDMSSGIGNALKNAFTMNTREFGKAIEQSLGKALQNAMIKSIMDQQFIKNAMGKVTRVIAEITADAKLTDDEIAKYKSVVEEAKTSMQRGKELADQLSAVTGIDLQQDNSTTNQTLEAGSTTNITYHQQYIVKAEAFNGTREEAEEFARLISPYVREELERQGAI